MHGVSNICNTVNNACSLLPIAHGCFVEYLKYFFFFVVNINLDFAYSLC